MSYYLSVVACVYNPTASCEKMKNKRRKGIYINQRTIHHAWFGQRTLHEPKQIPANLGQPKLVN